MARLCSSRAPAPVPHAAAGLPTKPSLCPVPPYQGALYLRQYGRALALVASKVGTEQGSSPATATEAGHPAPSVPLVSVKARPLHSSVRLELPHDRRPPGMALVPTCRRRRTAPRGPPTWHAAPTRRTWRRGRSTRRGPAARVAAPLAGAATGRGLPRHTPSQGVAAAAAAEAGALSSLQWERSAGRRVQP